MTDLDPQLSLKKRARRRLVGAVAFATFAAIVLPMVMDQAPPTPGDDVQILIPNPDGSEFKPQVLAAKPQAAPPVQGAVPQAGAVPPSPTTPTPPATATTVAPPTPAVSPDKPTARPSEATGDKAAADRVAAEKAAADKLAAERTAAEKKRLAQEKADKERAEREKLAKAEKEKQEREKAARQEARNRPAPAEDDAQRAAAILAGQAAPSTSARNEGGSHGEAGPHVILIGAYSNPGNVKQLREKLDEVGVRTYTEPLDSPQGPKTRLRAGPFPSREAAERALEKMKRVGVTGVVSAK